MVEIDFSELIVKEIAPNKTFANLRGDGITEILSCANDKIKYKKKESILYLPIKEIWAIYEEFKGKKIPSSDLKEYKPKTFDSKKGGHDCHCTTLLLIFKELNICENIFGEGAKGNPFSIEIIK